MDSAQKEFYSCNPEDFEILEPIGFGSSATVHLSLYKPKNLKVAIKVIDMDMFERNQIDELRRETQVMFLCKHPNLLQVYCSYVQGSKLHIVMPYLAAGSCLEILKYSHPEGLEEVYIASILKQALHGLEYLHKNGHIHRDIKAGNLLVDEQGSVLLADFGVSSSLNDHGERNKMRKTFVGTPCWMAPEVMEQAGYDHRADIWSFGITALELATGQAPLAKFPPIKVLMMTLSKEPPTLDRDQTKYKYSKTFKDMIDSCLSKDPSKRPSAEKLLQHSFFKQVKKIVGIIPLIKDLPPIEKRISKSKTPQQLKLPARGESWNFTPSNEKSDQSSYFESPIKNDIASPENMHLGEELLKEGGGQDFINLSMDSRLKSGSEKPKKSRFVIDTADLNKSDGPSSPPVSSEVKKGRFSVSEKPESPLASPVIHPQSGENVGQLPLTREASKSSRFSLSSEPGNVSPSDVGTISSQPSSFSKRGRFQVSNESGDQNFTPDADEILIEEPDHTDILMKYSAQLDSISQQNLAQRQVIEDLHTALSNGKSSGLPASLSMEKIIADQSVANGKADDAITDTLVPFQALIQQVLSENNRLRQENETLRAQMASINLTEKAIICDQPSSVDPIPE